MRTTITLDDDVASELEQLRRASGKTFKDVVNETLRSGLRPAPAPASPAVAYTHARSVGAAPDVSDVSAILAMLDEEEYAPVARRGRS